MLPLVMGLLCLGQSIQVNAQTAQVQIIHNAPDGLAAVVDIYVNGGATPTLDDFAFRSATPFLTLPAGTQTIGIAPGNSTGPGNILANIPITLVAGETYVVMASGILPDVIVPNNSTLYPGSVAANGANIGFDLKIKTMGQTTGTSTTGTDVLVFHGSTDAPTVDAIAYGKGVAGATIVDNLAYGTYTSAYATLPSQLYTLNVTPAAGTPVVDSFFVDLTPLANGAGVVFASGFLNPAQNSNGPAFGLFVALPNGTVLPLGKIGAAEVQVVHNCADPLAASVDIYVDWVRDSVKLDNVAFRSGTPFVTLPSGYPVSIKIAPATSTSSADAIASFAPTLMNGEGYYAIASGVVGTGFAANPSGVSTAFDVVFIPGAKATAPAGNIDLFVYHGATDAPEVGVAANGGLAVPAFDFKESAGYVSVPAAEYRIDVTAANNAASVIAPFYLDASGLGGNAALALASGFLTPSANNNGPAFGLYALLPSGGNFVALTAVGAARAQVVHNAADPGAATVDVYINTLADTIKLDNFAFRTATPFVNLPSGYPVKVVIAAPTSTGIGNGVIATIPVTAMNAETYHLIANGVLAPASFAVNPDGRSTAFQLVVLPGAKEAAAGTDVDVRVFHGATDAPTVDVIANFNQAAPLVAAAAYGDGTGYLTVPAAAYTLGVTPTGAGNAGAVARYLAPLSGAGGQALAVLASGFLTPSTNQNGLGFGLLAVFADGATLLLDNTTSIDLEQNNGLIRILPNPAGSQFTLEASLDAASPVAVKILDMNGRTVMARETQGVSGFQSWNFDASQLTNGVYFLELTTDKTRSVQKLVVRQ